MKVEDLYDEMGTSDSHLAHLQQADNADYEVEVDTGDEIVHVKGVRWEHAEKRMVIEL